MLCSLFTLLLLVFSTSAQRPKNPKRGISFASDVPADVINANQTDSLISWQYNWNSLPPVYLATSNIPYVPMQWGSVSIDSFDASVRIQSAPIVLGFNEPDFVNEANMDPTEAAELWMQFLEPLKSRGVRLGGPAVTASPTGRPWLQAFFQACNNCTIDFLPIHWYGTGLDGFYSYLWDVHNTYPQYPIWVTEYADTSTNVSDVINFLNVTMDYMDGLDWIERYAWFGYFRPKSGVSYNLLRDDGGLNELGELYLGAKTVHTQIVTAVNGATQTLNGADVPGQAAPTGWNPLPNAGQKAYAATARWIAWVGGIFSFGWVML